METERADNGQTAPKRSAASQTMRFIVAVVLIVALSFCAFIFLYKQYNDRILYAERLSQMQDVTAQLFSGLEDVVDNQWRTIDVLANYIQAARPADTDALQAFMERQTALNELDGELDDIIAVDGRGRYYTADGGKGTLQELDYLLKAPVRVSYVSNTITTNRTKMVFLKRLEQPIQLDDGRELVYYGCTRDMSELEPYFDCAAYDSDSDIYVVDSTGLKLFSGRDSDLIHGYNLYTVLEGMEYRHGTSFDAAREELATVGTAYSNAVLDGEEYFYAMYRMESAAWTLVFMVNAKAVAMNTVELVNTTLLAVAVFAVLVIAACAAFIYLIQRRQQERELAMMKQSNTALEKLNVELQSASQAKSNFLSNMSHDIRTPMNAIVGITKLMEHDRSDPEKMELYIHKVQSSSQHLLSLINDVLDMSKIESSEVTLNREPVSLAAEIGQVESIIQPQIEERGQNFVIRVHEITHEYFIGDAVRLRQIFINLLSNAVKYTPNGGLIQLDMAEVPSADPAYAMISATVTDNGYGMKPEFVEHIFEAFTRAENSTTNRVQGTGLGMAITKNIVDLMGGTITVQSEYGKGSCFQVTLPLLIDREKHPIDSQSVLLIAQEETLIQNVTASFQDTDIPFYVARNKAETEALLAEKTVDSILLAGHIHDRHLRDIVELLHREAHGAVLVFCVDYEQQEDVHDILEKSGVDGLIARPFFLANFSNVVNEARQETRAKEPETGTILKGMRFLCAEDNVLNAEILSALLDMQEASCVIYPDGQQLVDAFESVKPGDFDAILMDVQMPVMNGLDATQAIRRSANPLGKTIPIVAMTANAFSSDVQQCLDAGMDAHVSKPLDIATLERTLRVVMGRNASGGTPVRR